jgi:hypothetical protein
MAITLTKKVTSTYINPRPELGDADSPYDIVASYIHEQVAQGKTDGFMDILDSYSSVRLWVDQESAQAYADFIVSTMAGLGRTDLTNTITDI